MHGCANTIATNSDEPHYDVTPAAEKVIDWLTSLRRRQFVGTESRLMTVFELLRQIAEGSESDSAARIAELEKRKAQLDADIQRIREGQLVLMDATGVKDRFLQMAGTARALLSDFREVEQNFRELDRAVRERIATWEGALFEQLY
jgi:flagellar motility protein MotE (MotC chaperone)